MDLDRRRRRGAGGRRSSRDRRPAPAHAANRGGPRAGEANRSAERPALSVRSADGTALHAEAFGPEDGATVVLAHGWTETLSFWTYVIERLSQRGLRVVAYDLRGHGRSEPAAAHDYEMERFGEDLEAVLEACVPTASARSWPDIRSARCRSRRGPTTTMSSAVRAAPR